MNQTKEPLFELIVTREKLLIQAGAEMNPAPFQELLADNFFEFGSSGTTWTKSNVLASLSTTQRAPTRASGFKLECISPSLVLLNYYTVTNPHGEDHTVLRSSIWIKQQSGWKMVFHQGSLVITT